MTTPTPAGASPGQPLQVRLQGAVDDSAPSFVHAIEIPVLADAKVGIQVGALRDHYRTNEWGIFETCGHAGILIDRKAGRLVAQTIWAESRGHLAQIEAGSLNESQDQSGAPDTLAIFANSNYDLQTVDVAKGDRLVLFMAGKSAGEAPYHPYVNLTAPAGALGSPAGIEFAYDCAVGLHGFSGTRVYSGAPGAPFISGKDLFRPLPGNSASTGAAWLVFPPLTPFQPVRPSVCEMQAFWEGGQSADGPSAGSCSVRWDNVTAKELRLPLVEGYSPGFRYESVASRDAALLSVI